MNFVEDRAEFANQADGIQRKGEEYLHGSVRLALRRIGKRDWYRGLLRRVAIIARTAYRHQTGKTTSPTLRAAIERMLDDVADSLDKTSLPPKDQLESRTKAIASSLAAYANAVGTELAANDEPAQIGLEWVTMHDDKVRPAHVDADGQVRLPGQTYTVGGVQMSRPGDVTAPIELWINCRCVLRPVPLPPSTPAITSSSAATVSYGTTLIVTKGWTMPSETYNQVLDVEDVETDDLDGLDEIDDVESVPFHGVLAPENLVSGDGRKFASESLRWRDLPLPLAWQKVNDEGHKGSVVVGHIDNIWRDEEGMIQAEGEFNTTAEAGEAIGLIADKSIRGVSVDVDDATMSFEDDEGNEVTFDSLMDGERITQVITDGRICGATLCAIPAFMEASVVLGPRIEVDVNPDLEAEAESEEFRDVSTEERKRLAKSGNALPDGSFPIANVQDLKNAIQAIGRAKDPAKAKAHIKKRARALGHPELIPDTWTAEDMAEFVKTEDGPGWLTHPVDTERLRRYWVHGRGAAKIRWGVPGDFNRCRMQLAKYVKPQYLAGYCANRHYDALGFWPGRPVSAETETFTPTDTPFHLVASAVTTAPPRAWFNNPGLVEPTRLTVTTEGHIFGHLAQWGVCHIGIPGVCTTPPQSMSGYLYFATGMLDTDDGAVNVGQITMGCGHAEANSSPRVAAAHYDNLGWAVADINIGEDDIGIWFSGAIRPGTPKDQIDALRASGSVSGDWRTIGGNLELVAALAVNVPGFPIVGTQLAASGGKQTALVASGVVVQEAVDKVVLEDLVASAIAEHFAQIDRRKRMADLKSEAKRDPASKMAALASRRN